jgi:hypothetical protein
MVFIDNSTYEIVPEQLGVFQTANQQWNAYDFIYAHTVVHARPVDGIRLRQSAVGRRN